jgi:uncharacterized protein
MKFFAQAQALPAMAMLLLVWPVAALAQPKPPPPPKHYFTDATGVIPAAVGAQIEQRLQTFQKISSNQVLVVVSDRVPAGYASMEEYTNRTAQAWRAGVKGRDNGAVLFVFVSDRKLRIEVGYGLEGALPDALASRIINDDITPRFKENNYGAGLLAGVDAILKATRGEYKPLAARAYVAPVQPNPAPASSGPSTGDDPFGFFLAFVAFIVVLYWIFKLAAKYGGDGSGGGSWDSSSTTDWSSSGSYSSSDSSSSSSSDYSGGGGSFGGGGASGSW